LGYGTKTNLNLSSFLRGERVKRRGLVEEEGDKRRGVIGERREGGEEEGRGKREERGVLRSSGTLCIFASELRTTNKVQQWVV
jgi:hypothetical protein